MSETDQPAPGPALVAETADAEAIAAVDPFRRRVIVARTALCVGTLAAWQAAVSVGLIDPFWVSSPYLVAVDCGGSSPAANCCATCG
jgi:hypothetical protein